MHIQPCDIIEVRRVLSLQSSDDFMHFYPSVTRIWRVSFKRNTGIHIKE